ncbi:MAG: hypothetical protein AAF723_02680, partial [Pseudomonadota bacterium]
MRKNNGSGGTVLPSQKTPSHRVIRGVPNRVLFIALASIGSLIFVITAYALTNYVEAAPRYVSVLFTLVVLATISLCVLVLASLLDLYKSAKAGLRGARLHRRLVGLLTIIAIVPGVLAFTLT